MRHHKMIGSNIHVANLSRWAASSYPVEPSTVYELKACADDSHVTYCTYADLISNTTHDYFFYCDSSAWKKVYVTGPVVGSASLLTSVWEQCGVIPTSCSDLQGTPASEAWSGAGCDSSALSGNPFDLRWTLTEEAGTASLTGGKFRMTIPRTLGGVGSCTTLLSKVELTGDFDITFDVTMANFPDWSSTNRDHTFFANVGAAQIYWYKKQGDAGSDKITSNTGSIPFVDGGTYSLRFTRSGTTVSVSADATPIGSYTIAGTITDFYMGSFRSMSSTEAGETSVDFDNIVVEDGSSNAIYIDPSGDAC